MQKSLVKSRISLKRVVAEPLSLLQRIGSGDTGAMIACMERFRGLIWSLVRRSCSNAADAEDVVQEIFISLPGPILQDVEFDHEEQPRCQTTEASALTQAAMKKLRPEQQQVLQLSIECGCSHEQIATSTGLPLGTVKTHARRGLLRLREALIESGIDIDPIESV